MTNDKYLVENTTYFNFNDILKIFLTDANLSTTQSNKTNAENLSQEQFQTCQDLQIFF